MTRHKSRVARRSRRSARRGTRKQSGGWVFDFLNKLNPSNWGKNSEEKNAAPAVSDNNNKDTYVSHNPNTPAPHPAHVDEGKKGFFSGLFVSSNKDHVPAVAAQPPPPGQGGGRKTRHRRRSPRHHRK